MWIAGQSPDQGPAATGVTKNLYIIAVFHTFWTCMDPKHTYDYKFFNILKFGCYQIYILFKFCAYFEHWWPQHLHIIWICHMKMHNCVNAMKFGAARPLFLCMAFKFATWSSLTGIVVLVKSPPNFKFWLNHKCDLKLCGEYRCVMEIAFQALQFWLNH